MAKRSFDKNLERKRSRDEINSSPASENNNNSVSEDASGYNSEDEYNNRPSNQFTDEEWRQKDLIFARSLKKRGFIVKPMLEDGACLFRAIADQVYGDQEMHGIVRTHCLDYISKNRDFYSAFVTEDFNKYVTRKRHNHVEGNHLEIQALSEMYNRSIEVYCYQLKPINIFYGALKSDYEPIRLSYQRGSHYNSIINPFKPSVGVGLGLPDSEKRQKQENSATISSASSGEGRGSKSSNPPVPEESSSVNSNLDCCEGSSEETSNNFCETDSIFSRLPPEVFGLQDWEDADGMARVLAASQQEYLDKLKATRQNTSSR